MALVRLGIGHDADPLSQPISWQSVKTFATKHGLSAIVVDGIERLPENKRPPKEFLLQWIGESIQVFDNRYLLYRNAISEMARFYNAHHFKMMVLKGYACSLNWPRPEHRPCGDIDIWLFGQQKEADMLMAQEKGIMVDNSHHHHTVFYWRNFLVENHYDFVNVHHHKSNIELDGVFKELAKDDTHYVEVNGEKLYVPSPDFHAFFLLRHAMNHFASSELTIRQLLDWAFFAKAHGEKVDWLRLIAECERFGMMPLFAVFNAICVDELGFDATIFPNMHCDQIIKQRVLQELFSCKNSEEEPKWFLSRIIYKFRRWNANGWKHKLCYKESMWSAFWSGVWSHLLKPKSI